MQFPARRFRAAGRTLQTYPAHCNGGSYHAKDHKLQACFIDDPALKVGVNVVKH